MAETEVVVSAAATTTAPISISSTTAAAVTPKIPSHNNTHVASSPSNSNGSTVVGVGSAIRCLFCGGSACKYENFKNWTKDPEHPNAIEGLYSNWITSDILAMQRPSTRIMREYRIIENFKSAGITAIFNLQQSEEHESCGDGLDEHSHFSYRPEAFMDAGIYYYNFGWPDMSIPELEFALQMVHVMAHALENYGKIAVHCHAGLGRTGLAIACYLVYGRKLTPNEAILAVRSKRPPSIQTAKQQKFVHTFRDYLHRLQTIFPTPDEYPQQLQFLDPLTFHIAVENQRSYLAGTEARTLWSVPKIVYIITSHIRAFLIMKDLQSTADYRSHKNMAKWLALHPRTSSLGTEDDAASVCATIAEFQATREITTRHKYLMSLANVGDWDVLLTQSRVSELIELLLLWLVLLKEPFLSDQLVRLVAASSDTKLLNLIVSVDKEVFWTLNLLLDIFRYMPPETNQTEALHRLAILSTSERSVSYISVSPNSPMANGKALVRISSLRDHNIVNYDHSMGLIGLDLATRPDQKVVVDVAAMSLASSSSTSPQLPSQNNNTLTVPVPRNHSLVTPQGRDPSLWEVTRFFKMLIEACRVREDGVRPQLPL